MQKINLQDRGKRAQLKQRGKPYWKQIHKGLSVGYRSNERGGVWVVRKYVGGTSYKERVVGIADDRGDGTGTSYKDLVKRVAAGEDFFTANKNEYTAHAPESDVELFTVQAAIENYIDDRRTKKGENAAKGAYHSLHKWVPKRLLDKEVTFIKTKDLTRWHAWMVEHDPSSRDAQVKLKQALSDCAGDDAAREKILRPRKVTANKVLSLLVAALNLAYREQLIDDNSAWSGGRVPKFPEVEQPRERFLTKAEVRRLLKTAQKIEPAFHDLLKAAVLTGARYSEITAANVADFDPKKRTLKLTHRKGRGTPKTRTVKLYPEAMAHFAGCAKNKTPLAPLLARPDGERWGKSHQQRRMGAVIEAAGLPDDTIFYSLRHYYISQALHAGGNPITISDQCGTSVRMIEKTYAHHDDDTLSRFADTVGKAIL